MNIHAQNVHSIFFENPGLQIGSFAGNTQLQDNTFNHAFRYYNRYPFNHSVFGEFGLAIGFISGPGYRSRLIPTEYRIGYDIGSFHSYVGLGLLHHTPLSIPQIDDPLLENPLERTPSSPLWGFNRSIAPFIPLGAGYNLSLDGNTSLTLSLGYNHSLNDLRFSSDRVPNGYWSFSVGINFDRSRAEVRTPPQTVSPPPINPQPLPTPPSPPAVKPVEAPAENSMVIDQLNRLPVNFDNFSSHVNSDGKIRIKQLANILKLNHDVFTHIYGHADSTGTALVNQFISESRARAVWLALIDEGVDIHRLNISWFGDKSPILPNSTHLGRDLNRRVEFILNSSRQNNYRRIDLGPDDADLPIGSTMLDPDLITFDWMEYSHRDTAEIMMANIANMIRNRDDITMFVASVSDPDRNSATLIELDKARSEKLRAHLIKIGIDPDKIEAYNPYEAVLPDSYRQLLRPGLEQQTLIIPVEKEYLIRQEPSEIEMLIEASGQFSYYIIGGSFIMRNNAERLRDILISEGFTPHILFNPDTNWYYVAYTGFESAIDADRYLREIRRVKEKDAWLLKTIN